MKILKIFSIKLLTASSCHLIALIPQLALAQKQVEAQPVTPVTINIMHYRKSIKPILINLLSSFKNKTGHTIQLTYASIYDMKHLLLKGMMKDSLPDIVFSPSDVIALANAINLSPIPENLLIKELRSDAIKSVQFKGKAHGIPIVGGNHLVLYYNKKYVKTPAKTWQALRAEQAPLAAKGIKTIGFDYGSMYWFAAFAGTFGGAPITDGKITLNTQAYIDALTFYKELSTSGFISARCGFDCGHKDFMEQKFAYAINGDWSLLKHQGALGNDLGVSVIPAIGNKPFKPLFSTVALLFPGNSLSGSKQQALSALALYFQSKEFQDRMYNEVKLLPVRKDSFQQLEATAGPNMKMLLKQLSQAKPMSSEAAMDNAWAGMHKGWARYMKGILSAKEAVAYMQTFAERDYKKSQTNSK